MSFPTRNADDLLSAMPTQTSSDRLRGAGHYLLRSVIFLVILLVLGVLFLDTLLAGFNSNVYLNGTILGLFVFGVLYTLKALLSVYQDARAAAHAAEVVATARREGRPLAQLNEVLFAPSRRNIGEFLHTVYRTAQHGDAATLPYLLDSLAARGEDRRALVRYLSGGLVMLGLIGTFYGLLLTIGGVREVIGSLSADPSTDTVALLAGLKERLAVPLGGMSTAFSSSLFGLLGSLALAFLELQLFHALNHMHARLESLVVSELIPLWRPAGRAAVAVADSADPRYQAALWQAMLERLDRVAGLLEANSGARDSSQRVAEQISLLGERIESLRETLQDLERDRTADLRHELRALAHSLNHAPSA